MEERDANEYIEAKAAREDNEAREASEAREAKEEREAKEAREAREAKEYEVDDSGIIDSDDVDEMDTDEFECHKDVYKRTNIEDNKGLKDINNKINIIVDTSKKFYTKDDYKEGSKIEKDNEENIQEITFSKGGSEQTNIKTVRNFEEKEKNIVRNQWNNIKNEYNLLSQNKMDFKKTNKNDKDDHHKEIDEEDAISISSVSSVESAISNFTDISQIKKININEPVKNKKPSFF
jgi:hypothetical protein